MNEPKDCGMKAPGRSEVCNSIHTSVLPFNSGAKADWHSENVAVVTVDEDGMLCAKGVGKTDVVAVIYGKEYRCEVEVVE